VRPCWAHKKKPAVRITQGGFLYSG